MKSLNYNPIEEIEPSIFTKDILEWLEKEGFTISKNDAYCWDSKYVWEERCFYKFGGFNNGDWPIRIYIFTVGIGVDIDYDCGGNSSTMFWDFEHFTFEDAYDSMVDYVNSYKNS